MVFEPSSVTGHGRIIHSATGPKDKQPHIQLELAVFMLSKVSSQLRAEVSKAFRPESTCTSQLVFMA
jgi:hypothetical protein